jgi:glycosyltransferase involved in cell wall biosynthesis
MRVLMTTDTVGGVWIFTHELAAGLLRNGCPVALVSFGRNPSPSQQAWCDELARTWGPSFCYTASDLPLEWMPDNSRSYSAAASLLMAVAGEFRPDIFLTSQFCFGALPLDVPKFVIAHSDVLSWADHCRKGSLKDSAWLRRYRRLVQNGLAAADVVVAPTHWMLQALAANFLLPHATVVIPNGRTIPAVEPGQRKLQAITAGRLWDEAKNVSMLRDVDCPVPLFIAGETLTAEPLPLPNATSLGALPPEQLLAHFRASSIYLCTSRYEPFGLAPLEAALCGCAIVANDIPSLHEVWRSGALYFSSPASLTALLYELCADAGRLRATQRSSFRRASQFTTRRMVEGYIQLFRMELARVEDYAYAS